MNHTYNFSEKFKRIIATVKLYHETLSYASSLFVKYNNLPFSRENNVLLAGIIHYMDACNEHLLKHQNALREFIDQNHLVVTPQVELLLKPYDIEGNIV